MKTAISVAVDETGREIPITLEEIAESGEHTLEEVEKALEVVQAFDPPGVAARDLRECLMIQLRSLGEDDCYSHGYRPRSSCTSCRTSSSRKSPRPWASQLEEIMEAVEIVKASRSASRPEVQPRRSRALIEPDVFIVKVGGEYTVVTNEDEVPQLRLSTDLPSHARARCAEQGSEELRQGLFQVRGAASEEHRAAETHHRQGLRGDHPPADAIFSTKASIS